MNDRKVPSSRALMVLAILLTVFFSIVASAAVTTLYPVLKSRSFATTAGVLIDVKTERLPGRAPAFRIEPRYRYVVQGVPYEGTKFRFGWSLNRSDTEYAMSALRSSNQLTVYYDPSNPARAVLHNQFTKGDRFTAIFAGAGTGLAAACWAMVGVAKWRRGSVWSYPRVARSK